MGIKTGFSGLGWGSAILVIFCGCMQEEKTVSPSQDGLSPWEDKAGNKADPEFDITKINTSSAPVLFRDDTLPPDPVADPSREWQGVPLRKAAATTWTQLPGLANDVAVGRYFYCIDKTTLKLKKWVSGEWTIVRGPIVDGMELTFKRISAAKNAYDPNADVLAAIASNGGTYRYNKDKENSANGPWDYLTGGGYGIDIAVSEDTHARTIQYIGSNNTLYRWSNDGGVWEPVAGQAGLRLASGIFPLSGGVVTYIVSTGNRLWRLNYDINGKAISHYFEAYHVNDVCRTSYRTNENSGWVQVMHSGSGYIYKLVPVPDTDYLTWKKVGGDSNTRNLACTYSEQQGWYIALQTNNDGQIFYTQIPRL